MNKKDELQKKINESIDNVSPPEIPEAITREQYHKEIDKLKRHIKYAIARKIFDYEI